MQTPQLTVGDPRGPFFDLFDESKAAELVMRAQIVDALQRRAALKSRPESEIARDIGVTQSQVSQIQNGNISQLSLDELMRIAQRAGL